jgi:hypothetical protein
LLSFLNKNYFVFYQKYICQDKYPAGYLVSGPNRISGQISGIRLMDKPDIQLAGYPAKTVSGASLYIIFVFPIQIRFTVSKSINKTNLAIKDKDTM